MRSDVIGNMESASDKELLSILFPSASNEDNERLLENMYKPGFDADDPAVPRIVRAVMELGRRLNLKRGRTVSSPEDVYREVRHYASTEQEYMVVVLLNGAHEVIKTFVATIGTLDRTVVHSREIYSEAIRMRAASVAIAHNHPSGTLMPSQDDKDVTARLVKAGQLLGIKLLDHLIFTDERYYSFLEHGLI